MPTYRDLYDKLATLSPEQLDDEIMIVPVGYTDDDAAAILRYDLIPKVLEIAKAPRNLYHYRPVEDSDWIDPAITDFDDDEVRDMGIDNDEEYTLICRKGKTILKIRDDVALVDAQAASIGNLDTSILHL